MSNKAAHVRTLGSLADDQAERWPQTEFGRGRIAGGRKRTSRPLVSNGRPLRRYELAKPDQATDDVGALYQLRRVITLIAIGVGGLAIDIEGGDLDERMIVEDLDPDCLTQEGDVILALSSPFASACIDDSATGLFIPSTCAVVRMDEKTREVLDPWYLAGYLNRDAIRNRLFSTRAASGSGKTLTIDDLLKVEIELPPIRVQHALGEMLRAEAEALRAQRAVRRTREAMIDQAFADAISLSREVNG